MSSAYPPIDKSFVGQLKDLRTRIDQLSRRKNRPSVLRGSTAERDAIFGVPTTDVERVVLANQRLAWFNTDTGWEESYYAVTGLAGLTATGLLAGTASGWYPTGPGPWVVLEPTATFAATAGAYVGGWNGTVRKRDPLGTAFTTAATYIACNLPGYYYVEAWTHQAPGTGTADWHFRHTNPAGTVVNRQQNRPGDTLISTLWTRAFGFLDMEPMAATDRFMMFCASGALAVHNGGATNVRAQMAAIYRAPLLVSN